MAPTESFRTEISWQEDSFRFVKPDEFKAFGIDPSDIPLGTFAALKHPSQLQSRFGGNAYGFGFFELYDRAKPEDIKLIQSTALDDPESVRQHHKELNDIYKKIGLLVRFSSLGKPYYLIPVHLVSNTQSHIKSKVDEITKIVGFHRKKYFKEHHDIGLITYQDDLIAHELTFRFKEHRFAIIDSLEKLRNINKTMDMVIFTWDLFEIVLDERFSPLSREILTKKRLDQYVVYILWKVYNLLKPDGEVFIIASHHAPKTNRVTRITFKTEQEEKNFALFTHIFKTKKKYNIKNHALQVNIFDFRKYMSDFYVEEEVINKLLGGKHLEDMTLRQINNLPYINYQLTDWPFLSDQERIWSRLLPICFDKIFLKALVPQSVKKDWEKRFSFTDYTPDYMMIYLGQKKPLKTTMAHVKRDVMESRLTGCPTELLADYRDSFEYVIKTLSVLQKLKKGGYEGLPQNFVDRLKQPLDNKSQRFSSLNNVIKLITKIKKLEKISGYFNPDKIEGLRTRVIENLEALTFFGFSHDDLKEILYIVLGHTPMGRIISGKVNEKSLKPVSDLARTYDPQQALNLLRYCLLMTMAETQATRRSELSQEELAELFDLYESTVRIVTNRELDWDRLLDEKITSMGGIHNRIVRKLLKMMNHFGFLDNWSELKHKGQMEKEALADYDDQKLSRIENVIELVSTIEQFEEMYLKFDPLQLPVFYRNFLAIEFHGTGHLFERMDSQHVFTLLWITVSLARGEVINFNPILADLETSEIENRVRKVEKDAGAINIHYLDHAVLRQFSEQLYLNRTSLIMGTGFQLKVDQDTQSLEITYLDMDKNIEDLETLTKQFANCPVSEIPVEDLKRLEVLFSNQEIFYQSHLRFLKQADSTLKLPERQKRWFKGVQDQREYLRSNFMDVIFRPEDVYTDLDLLYRHSPSLLNFILPEFGALQDLDLSWHLYLTSPVSHYIITATKKLQALVRHDRESFQDTQFLYRLAQREFGPLATGIVGVSESQIEDLEKITEHLSHNRPLFDALIRSFIFQDIGRIPALREKYKSVINPADLAYSGALFLEKEKISERYNLDKKGKDYLIFLVKYHSLMHHIVRGELSFSALQEVLDTRDKDLFDAFFLLSFVMLSSIREDLILEDLAGQLFQIRALSHRIIDSETIFEDQLDEVYARRGSLFYALEAFQKNGLPDGIPSARYLESNEWAKPEKLKCIRSGKMIFALERLFRLRGIKYVGFLELVNLMLKVPLKFIYKERKFSSTGYSTFEKEVYEAFRVYNTLQNLAEETRHFILNQLVGDKIRIFGYEKVSGYLSYKNQIKLLLIGLRGANKFKPHTKPVCLNFLGMCEEVDKRYEALNDYLNSLSIETIWSNKNHLNQLFKAKTGLLLKKEEFPNVLSLDFRDRINISQKISHMDTINNIDQLKNYFHHSLQSIRKHPFYTEDYGLQLESMYKKRLTEITDKLLNQTKKQMDLIKDFKELHNLVNDLLYQSLDIGLSDDQKHRLNDLFELRKDSLKREKLSEIDSILETIHDIDELNDYWESIKWYLQSNRQFFGKEFESLISKKFDAVRCRTNSSHT
jgi:hypothetical protein